MNTSSKINFKKLYCKLSALSIFMLSTVFIIYHTYLNQGSIPAFLGGFFGPITLFTFLLFIPTFYKVTNDSVKANLYLFLIGISSLLIALLVTITNSLKGIGGVQIQSFDLIFYWVTMYVVGFYFLQADKKIIYKFNVIFLVVYAIYTAYFLISENRVMLNFGFSEEESVSNYQGIARSFLIVSLIVISYSKNVIHEILLTAICFFLLFAVGARSEFFAFIMLIALYHSIFIFKKKSSFIILALSILIIGTILTTYYDFISQSRQFQVVDLDSSSSFNLRENFEEYAFLQISQNPIFGSFGSHATLGSVGSYAHNALSGYVNYGLFFFLLYMTFFISATFYSTLKMFDNPSDKDWKFCSLTLIIMLFLVLTAKPVFWPVLYLSFGIFMSKLYVYKTAKIISKIN